MYAKLFSRITESSLMEEPINVRYTFVLMLAIADPEGYVIGTDVAIARRLNMPLDEFERCIEVLMAPDPHSNSKELDGVRIVNSEGERGYRIVNFVTYREMKSPEERRTYMRQYMQRYRKRNDYKQLEKPVNTVNNGKPELAELGQAEAEDSIYISDDSDTEKRIATEEVRLTSRKLIPKSYNTASTVHEIARWMVYYPSKFGGAKFDDFQLEEQLRWAFGEKKWKHADLEASIKFSIRVGANKFLDPATDFDKTRRKTGGSQQFQSNDSATGGEKPTASIPSIEETKKILMGSRYVPPT